MFPITVQTNLNQTNTDITDTLCFDPGHHGIQLPKWNILLLLSFITVGKPKHKPVYALFPE